MSRELRSLLIWTAVFFAAELPPVFWPGCPWNTFTGTVRGGVAWWWPVSIYVAVFAFVAVGHFDWHWSARWLITAAAFGAALFCSHAVELAIHAKEHT